METEKEIKDEIRKLYAKTYPNIIFNLTDKIKRMEAYLESITEHKLYCIILAVQEEIERSGTSLNLLQSHRKLMAKAIKNMIDGGV